MAQSYQLLGGPPAAKSAKRVVAKAVVVQQQQQPARWRLSLVTETAGAIGRRSIEAASCDGLADAAALIVALAFDPDAVAATAERARGGGDGQAATTPFEQPEPPSFETLPPAPPKLVPPLALPPPTPPRVARVASNHRDGEPLRWAVSLNAAVDVGSLPAPAFGLGAALSASARLTSLFRIRAALRPVLFFPQHAFLAGSNAVGGDFDFFNVGLAGCPELSVADADVGLCVGMELGRMAAEGFGVDTPERQAVLWSALPLGLSAGWRFYRPFGLRLDLGAAVPLSRPRWLLEDIGDVDRPGVVAARGFFAIESVF